MDRALKVVLRLSGAGLLLFSASAAEAEPLEQSRRLVETRLEVERRSEAVTALRSRLAQIEARADDAELRQKLELEAQSAHVRALRARLAEARSDASREAEAKALDPEGLLAAIERIRSGVQAGLPFRREERAEALSELSSSLREGRVEPGAAAMRLWKLVREELRLAETSGLAHRSIEVDGKVYLADVARLGLVALLWSLPDGRTGYTIRDRTEGWRFVPTETPEEAHAVLGVLDALGRGRTPGRLLVPTAALESPR